GDRVGTWTQPVELVRAVGIRGGCQVDHAAEVVGTLQPNRHALNAVLAKVYLAVVVEVLEDQARQAGWRDDLEGNPSGGGQEVAVAAVAGRDMVAAESEGAGAQRGAVEEGDSPEDGPGGVVHEIHAATGAAAARGDDRHRCHEHHRLHTEERS